MSSSLLESERDSQEAFNPIRVAERFELIQGGKISVVNILSKLRIQLYKAIDDIRYSEGMLMAYDGDRKGVRSQLRSITSFSRTHINNILTQLNAPIELIENRPEYESSLQWVRDIDQWMEESEGLDMKTGTGS